MPRPRRDRQALIAVLVGAGAFGCCIVAGWGAWKLTSLRRFDLDIVTSAPPPPDHFLAHDRGGHVDHHVLFHGMDEEALRHLREADVLLMGNSRLMFALRGPALRQYFTARGMKPFCPYRDKPDVSMSYYTVPADVLDDAEDLVTWARRSVAIAAAKPP